MFTCIYVRRIDITDVLTELAGSTFDENATIDQGLKKLGLPNTRTVLLGMSKLLLPHQILGVAWMLEREAHRCAASATNYKTGALTIFIISSDRGGILADEMGLGK